MSNSITLILFHGVKLLNSANLYIGQISFIIQAHTSLLGYRWGKGFPSFFFPSCKAEDSQLLANIFGHLDHQKVTRTSVAGYHVLLFNRPALLFASSVFHIEHLYVTFIHTQVTFFLKTSEQKQQHCSVTFFKIMT